DVLVQALGALAQRDPARPLPLLVIIGGPSGDDLALAKLKDLAGQAGVSEHIRWQPPVPRLSLPQWFRAADVVAVPSRSESFGLVAAEAQAVGTPVLAADVGGLQTIIKDGDSGLLVPTHAPKDWAEKIRMLLGDRALYDRLARGAWERASELSWDSAAEAMITVYRNAWADLRQKRRRVSQRKADESAVSGVPEWSPINLNATG
ncbi:MAG TPA: glycosyltransferase, partial [Actinomycetales bacterium]|nr:glycosyltransferase [Actinomycetales bacterium]